ncbi:MAG TPA: SDR family oxidoreductase [Tepidisphaeraceae bacterium]|nr:SDR family oxidoreductase [Tepidisphaeraceae bacterium]
MNQPVAIITGAGRGIGRATAVELSGRGYAVVLVSRNETELADAATRCGKSLIVPADVTSDSDVERIVAESIKRFGRIDAVVNNAGYAPMLSIEQTSIEEFRKVLDANLTSAFAMSRACWPTFVKQGGGVIVNVSSMAAKDPRPGFVAYGPAKAGVNILGLTLAREGAPHGIRVHTIAPGSTETKMFRALLDETAWPKSKTMPPEDVAGVIAACVVGDLKHTSGETIYLRKEPG